MKVWNNTANMEVKNTGVEFAVRDNDNTYRGKLYVTKSKIIWCNGKTRKSNGIEMSWDDFIDWMNEEEE